jgi:hypothetical protein
VRVQVTRKEESTTREGANVEARNAGSERHEDRGIEELLVVVGSNHEGNSFFRIGGSDLGSHL